MRTFDVYRHEEHGYQAVKQGLSWPALLFGVLWLFSKKLWLIAIVATFFQVGVGILAESLENNGSMQFAVYIQLLAVIVLLLIGFKGNSWVNSNLIKKEYKKIGTLQAKNPNVAIINAVESKEIK